MAKDTNTAMSYILDDGLAGKKKSKRNLKKRVRRQVKRQQRQVAKKELQED